MLSFVSLLPIPNKDSVLGQGFLVLIHFGAYSSMFCFQYLFLQIVFCNVFVFVMNSLDFEFGFFIRPSKTYIFVQIDNKDNKW